MLINKSPFVIILVICCKNYKQRKVKRKFTFTEKIINNKNSDLQSTSQWALVICWVKFKEYAKLSLIHSHFTKLKKFTRLTLDLIWTNFPMFTFNLIWANYFSHSKNLYLTIFVKLHLLKSRVNGYSLIYIQKLNNQ
jgi:hypothetical protein